MVLDLNAEGAAWFKERYKDNRLMNNGDPLALGCSLYCDFWIPGTIVRKLNGQSGMSVWGLWRDSPGKAIQDG